MTVVKKFRWTAALSAASLFALIPFANVKADSGFLTPPQSAHYLALGDSLATGYEPNNPTSYGFVDHLYEQYLMRQSVTLQNDGISGLTSTGLKNLLEAAKTKSQVSLDDLQPNLAKTDADQILVSHLSQLQKDIASANLITITIGGDDFLSLFETLFLQTDDQLKQTIAAQVPGILSTYQSNVTTIIQDLIALNPNAKIVIANQYQPYPDQDDTRYQALEQVSSQLTSTLQAVLKQFQANGHQVSMVDVASIFKGNERTDTNIDQYDIHPTLLGYQLMAQAFANTIWGTGNYQVLTPQTPITIVLDGKEHTFTDQPIIVNGRTYLPIRAYAETVGATVSWDQASHQATISYQGATVVLQINSDTAEMNGQSVTLMNRVQLMNSRTYVPLRALANILGMNIQYIAQSNTVYLNTK